MKKNLLVSGGFQYVFISAFVENAPKLLIISFRIINTIIWYYSKWCSSLFFTMNVKSCDRYLPYQPFIPTWFQWHTTLFLIFYLSMAQSILIRISLSNIEYKIHSFGKLYRFPLWNKTIEIPRRKNAELFVQSFTYTNTYLYFISNKFV